MKYYGKIDFPSQSFDFSNFDGTNNYILFSELYGVKDINDKDVENIRITFNNPSPYTIRIFITFADGTSDTALSDINNINQDLDTQLFGGDIIGYGCLSTNSIYDEDNIPLLDAVDQNENVIFLYKLNSEKNVVTKNLVWMKTLLFSFNHPIKFRDLLLDIKIDIDEIDFNYVYISSLRRFYFVNDMTLTNNYAQLVLHEDVLSTWDELIRQQFAFIERNQNIVDYDKVDDLITYDYDKEITYTTITPTNDIFLPNDHSLPSVFVVITVDARQVPVTP